MWLYYSNLFIYIILLFRETLNQKNKSWNKLITHFKNFHRLLLENIGLQFIPQDYLNLLPGNSCISIISNPGLSYLGFCLLLIKPHIERSTFIQTSKSQKCPKCLFWDAKTVCSKNKYKYKHLYQCSLFYIRLSFSSL